MLQMDQNDLEIQTSLLRRPELSCIILIVHDYVSRFVLKKLMYFLQRVHEIISRAVRGPFFRCVRFRAF